MKHAVIEITIKAKRFRRIGDATHFINGLTEIVGVNGFRVDFREALKSDKPVRRKKRKTRGKYTKRSPYWQKTTPGQDILMKA